MVTRNPRTERNSHHVNKTRLGFRFVEPNPPGPTKRMRAVEREVRIPLYDEGRRKTLTNAECSADER